MSGDIGQAAALHRRANALALAVTAALEATGPAPIDHQREQHELAERLRAAAGNLAPGWLGAPLDAQTAETPLGGQTMPGFVRVGTAQPLDDARFPAIVPLLGHGHLTIDADGRDPRVAGLLRCLLLRLIAAAPAGSLLIRAVDPTDTGVFAPFTSLTEVGLLAPVATDHAGLRALLSEAEHWVRPVAGARGSRHVQTLLVVVAALPELVEGADLARLSSLAEHGADAGLHLIIAGWPPPPLTAETTAPPLARSTMVAIRNPDALVGDPPGASFGTPLPHVPSAGLNSPVFLDPDPPARLVERVCARLAQRSEAGTTRTTGELLPGRRDELWTCDPGDGLITMVGHDGDTPVTLRFNELTPHWLVCGRRGAGKTAFLTNVLLGLCANYAPDKLSVYLLNLTGNGASPVLGPLGEDPPWLPQIRLARFATDRGQALAVLTDLATRLADRSPVPPRSGPGPAPDGGDRILCVLDGFHLLLAGDDPTTTEALAVLDALARGGRSRKIHLLLAGQPSDGQTAPALGGLSGLFPVRVALPGGAQILEPANDSAAGLPTGTAVINTAGGLGGPRGATRGHERVVRFPDPAADPAALDTLRRRIRAIHDVGRPDHPPIPGGRREDRADVVVPFSPSGGPR